MASWRQFLFQRRRDSSDTHGSKRTSIVPVTDDVTKLRKQIGSSSCVNNGGKYSETKKSVLDLSWHVCCGARVTATMFDIIAMP